MSDNGRPAPSPVAVLANRIPPHNLEAERAVLGAALLDRESLATLVGGALRPADFYKDGHRRIFAAMLELAERGTPVDLVTLSEELKRQDALQDVGGVGALAGLVEEATAAVHTETYAAIVREKALARELISVSGALIGRIYEGREDVPALLADASSALTRLVARGGPAAGLGRAPLGLGLGEFLAGNYQAPDPYVEGLLTSEGSGWIAGEEKLGKSLYALHEGLCLALGEPVAGRFPVPERRAVLFIEEEDPPRRVWGRVRALLRGLDRDPDSPMTRADLDEWFRIAVWSGLSLDDPHQVERLDTELAAFPASVVYLDVLRKLTRRDLNKALEAGALLGVLDDLRRRRGVVFRLLHHFRKAQGFRVGRGSQEIGGSFALGAWGEASLFFEPVGRKQGAVRVDVQAKDGAPIPGFRLVLRAEGPRHAPEILTVTAEDLGEDTSADDQLEQAVATLPKTEALAGKPGVSVAALAAALKRSDKTVRRGLKRLQDAGRVEVTGQVSKGAALYGIVAQ